MYISTYNYLETNIGKYDYDLELIDLTNDENDKVLKEGRGVSKEELIKEFRLFLK